MKVIATKAYVFFFLCLQTNTDVVLQSYLQLCSHAALPAFLINHGLCERHQIAIHLHHFTVTQTIKIPKCFQVMHIV